MKLLQKSRLGVQLLFLLLTIIGFMMNFQGAMMVIMLSTFFVGVFFCGWICPYGTMQDLFSKLGSLLKIKKRKMPKAIQKILKYSRYLIFLFVTFVTADFIFSLMTVDPRSGFERLIMGNATTTLALIIMVGFLIISMFFERPFCNYLCHEGARYGLMSYFRIFRIKRNDNSCVNCKKCDKACPMNIEVSTTPSVTSAQCINCMECVSACPVSNTLTYSVAKQRFTVKSLFILLIIAYVVFSVVSSGGRKEHNDSPQEVKATTEVELNIGAENTDLESTNTLYTFENGEYFGSGMGFRGEIQVSVTVAEGNITDVEVVNHRDDRKWFNRANRTIPSAIIEAQSTDIDVVSGATYTSRGIIDGVKDALSE